MNFTCVLFLLEARAQTEASSIAQRISRETRTDLPSLHGKAFLPRALEISKGGDWAFLSERGKLLPVQSLRSVLALREVLCFSYLTQRSEEGTTISPILQMRNLRLTEVQILPHSHAARKWWRQKANLRLTANFRLLRMV